MLMRLPSAVLVVINILKGITRNKLEDNDSGGDISAIISDLNVSKDENICIFRVFRNRHPATAMAKQLSLARASHGRGPHSCGN